MKVSRPHSGASARRIRGARQTLRLALAVTALGLTALSGCSRDQATVYAAYSKQMQERGRFRTETAPMDAPFTERDAARNLLLVAFEPEEQLKRFYKDAKAERRLSKWTRSPRYAVMGDAVRANDRVIVRGLARQLSEASGMTLAPISRGTDGTALESPDITIFIIGEEQRRELARKRENEAWYADSIVRDWIETPNPPCFAVLETAKPEGGAIDTAAIFIKGELEAPLRAACLTEELTQSLGPIFDHPEVRPSIFNDDQEFIALTRHDELLLELLYAPELNAGMKRAEASSALHLALARREDRRKSAGVAMTGSRTKPQSVPRLVR